MKTCVKGELLRAIGSQLRKLKVNNDRTTKEIAALLNITPQAYGNIERGETGICITKLIQLAIYYKVPLAALFPEEYQKFENDYPEPICIKKENLSFNEMHSHNL